MAKNRSSEVPDGTGPGASQPGGSPVGGPSPSPAVDRGADRGDGADQPRREGASLDVLKALGDNTRYAIYLELARSALPLSTADVAEALDLHVNTVRPHLERMRDVGLLEVSTEGTGGVGRPQHRYALAADAPSLGLEPSPWPTLASVLVRAAADSGLDPQDVGDAAAVEGADRARRVRTTDGTRDLDLDLRDVDQADDGTSEEAPAETSADGDADGGRALGLLVAEQQRLGYDPEVVEEAGVVTVAFAHCPFRALAEADPQVVCAAHCGMVTGFVEELAVHSVSGFHSIVDRTPCQVELVRASSTTDTL